MKFSMRATDVKDMINAAVDFGPQPDRSNQLVDDLGRLSVSPEIGYKPRPRFCREKGINTKQSDEWLKTITNGELFPSIPSSSEREFEDWIDHIALLVRSRSSAMNHETFINYLLETYSIELWPYMPEDDRDNLEDVEQFFNVIVRQKFPTSSYFGDCYLETLTYEIKDIPKS